MAGFQPYTKGYDASFRRSQDPPGHNGMLTFNGVSKKLWIQRFQTGFNLSGSAANSYRTRSFFARNFEQGGLVVECQFPDQQRYAEMTEFIRHAQVGFGSSTRLEIVDRSNSPNTHSNQKGSASSIVAEGYVKSVERKHERWIAAPVLVFEFAVEKMISPSEWADNNNEKIAYLKSWKEIVTNPYLEEDDK